MKFFKKKKKEEDNNFDLGDKNLENNKLPELPKLDFNKNNSSLGKPPSDDSDDNLNKLPSLPDNSFGEKLSQDTIKSVVGEKEDTEGEESDEDSSLSLKESSEKNVSKNEKPIFVKLDNFEEGMDVFKKTKSKISEIESTLKGIKEIRDEEQKQLKFWEDELQKIKNDISIIEKNIFSKIK
ncbi:MAG: hypothetical protein ACOC3Z_03290 [Nanoarchaeota archaeon]